MKPLKWQVRHHVGEPPRSFCSRLSWRNLIQDPALFCRDFEISHKGMLNGEDDALAALAHLGGADYNRLAASAILPERQGQRAKFQFSKHRLARYDLKSQGVDVCPQCLMDDAASSEGPLNVAAYERTIWQIAPIRTCPIHCGALVSLTASQRARSNFCAIVQDTKLWPTWLAAATPRPLSGIERHILLRLAGKEDGSAIWLNGIPLRVAYRLAEILGAVEVWGPNVSFRRLTSPQWWEAGYVGYNIVSQGITGIHHFLQKQIDKRNCRAGDTGLAATAGKLNSWLMHHREDSDFDELRQVFREFALATFPIEAGHEVLGEPIAERRLHSIQSASREFGVHPQTLRKLLHAAGVIPDSHVGKTDHSVVFAVAPNADFLSDVSTALSFRQAAKYLNTTVPGLRQLVDDGILRPLVQAKDASNMISLFAVRYLDEFLLRLYGSCRERTAEDSEMIDLILAARITRHSVSTIIWHLLNGTLMGRREPGEVGVGSIRLNCNEVRRVMKHCPRPGYSLGEAEKLMKASRSVLAALVRHGHIKSVSSQRNWGGKGIGNQIFLTSDEIAIFQEKFISISTLAKERNAFNGTLNKDLAQMGIHPAFDRKQIGATFYRRSDLPV